VRRQDLIAVAVLVAITSLLCVKWADRVVWTSDALYYQARVLEIRGQDAEESRREVFYGPLAAKFRAADALRAPEYRLFGPGVIDYKARFYRRRLAVPLAAAAIHPVAKDDSLEAVALIGALLFAPALFLLLRQRFGTTASAISVAICLLWPPLRWAFLPLTDSWGLVLEVVALLAAVLTVDRGRRWLPLWVATILVLGFTRDLTIVPISAGIALALLLRTPDAIRLAWAGILAALPPLLLFTVPAKEQLAFLLNGRVVPEEPSWGFVLDRYPEAVEDLLTANWDFIGAAETPYLDWHELMPPLAVVSALGLLALLFLSPWGGRDAFLVTMRASLLGGIASVLLLPGFSYLRLELVFLPAIAAGLAMGGELVREALKPADRSPEG
jgi:hypothetical protein